jgi:hypothetical protein
MPHDLTRYQGKADLPIRQAAMRRLDIDAHADDRLLAQRRVIQDGAELLFELGIDRCFTLYHKASYVAERYPDMAGPLRKLVVDYVDAVDYRVSRFMYGRGVIGVTTHLRHRHRRDPRLGRVVRMGIVVAV